MVVPGIFQRSYSIKNVNYTTIISIIVGIVFHVTRLSSMYLIPIKWQHVTRKLIKENCNVCFESPLRSDLQITVEILNYNLTIHVK